MIVDIYESQKHPHKYISVPKGQTPSAAGVPDAVLKDYGQLTISMPAVDLSAGPRLAIRSEQVMQDIQANGYALHEVSITTTIGQPGKLP